MCGTIRIILKRVRNTFDVLQDGEPLTIILYRELSDDWTLTKSQASPIQVAEMRFLRHVEMDNLQDRRINTTGIKYHDYTRYDCPISAKMFGMCKSNR